MGAVTVAVHQPNYLPWLGYFHKLASADYFVLLDTVQFERRGYTHRVLVQGAAAQPHWLTQHVRKQPQRECMLTDVVFADDLWVRKHLGSLRANYGKRPAFEQVFPFLEQALRQETDRLADYNGALVAALGRAMQLPARILPASELDIGTPASASDRIARLVAALGGDVYLSGQGARKYNDDATFARHGVAIRYNDPQDRLPPPARPYMTGGLSIVDALFQFGFDALGTLLREAAADPVRAAHPSNI